MKISYENYQYSDFVRSVAFDMSFYTGGAHPNSGFKTFNFDVNQDKELSWLICSLTVTFRGIRFPNGYRTI